MCILERKQQRPLVHLMWWQGDDWALYIIKKLQRKIACKDIVCTPSNQKGFTREPIIDCVKPCNIMVSLLHCEIWCGNKILLALLELLDVCVEDQTEAEEEPEGEVVERELELEAYNFVHPANLAAISLDRKRYIAMREKRKTS